MCVGLNLNFLQRFHTCTEEENTALLSRAPLPTVEARCIGYLWLCNRLFLNLAI